MSDGWSPHEFQVVRRGYEPQQVDDTFAHLVRDLTVLRSERDALRRSCTELETRVMQLATETHDAPTYRGLGDRVERILMLAEEEAVEVRRTASAEAEHEREGAQRDADSIRADADAYSEETRVRVDTDARHLLEVTRRQADALREDAERFARTRRDEVDNLFEHNRAKAAQAATDFEIMLAQRREQAERDFALRMSAATAQLTAAEHRAAAVQSEAAQARADADRRAAQTLAAANRHAEERVEEAEAQAERVRQDSERELAAMVQRRDSINQQLTNVRQMLATLTGSAAAIDPLAATGILPAETSDASTGPTPGDPAPDEPTPDEPTANGPAPDDPAPVGTLRRAPTGNNSHSTGHTDTAPAAASQDAEAAPPSPAGSQARA